MEGIKNMKEYFTFFQAAENKWILIPTLKYFSDKMISGSFNLLACRISGLSWPQWIRYCRQNGADIYGKKSLYPIIQWKSPNKEFLNELNKRANILSEKISFKELEL